MEQDPIQNEKKVSRKAISKKLRFEVFKRDAFTCQYCGMSAPDAILHVDHINPVAAGGQNEVLNLVTSCVSCNLGKGARTLSDSTVVKKQLDQMKAISLRQEQLAMMAEWRNSMVGLEENAIKSIADYINRNLRSSEFKISDTYLSDIRNMLRRYSVEDIYSAIDKSVMTYLKDTSTQSVDAFLYYIPRICYWQKLERENPMIAQVNRIVGLASKRWYHCNRQSLHRDILTYHEKHGLSLDLISANVMNSTGIMQFNDSMAEVIDA
ncbi:MAG: HNH endonuclease [Bdellovibrionales bacterium]|nr:HNH endonuclease [Bdellovibrionales bacterium]